MENIMNWLNTYQGVIMVFLTLVYVLTTILLLISNRRQRKQYSNIQKQNVNIQLFEKRFAVYNELKINLAEKQKADKNPYGYLEHILASYYDTNKIRSNIMMTKYLFSEDSNNKLSEIEKIIKELLNERFNMRHIIDLLKISNENFYNQIGDFIEEEVNGNVNEKKEKEFRELCDKNEILIAIEPDDYKKYNYYKMDKRVDELSNSIDEKKKLLFKQIEQEISLT